MLAADFTNTDPEEVLAADILDRCQKVVTARTNVLNSPLVTNEMTKAEIQAEQKKRQAQCHTYRDRLEDFLRSQRLYQEDDAGERHYLSEDEVIAARLRVEEQIQEYCGSS